MEGDKGVMFVDQANGKSLRVLDDNDKIDQSDLRLCYSSASGNVFIYLRVLRKELGKAAMEICS